MASRKGNLFELFDDIVDDIDYYSNSDNDPDYNVNDCRDEESDSDLDTLQSTSARSKTVPQSSTSTSSTASTSTSASATPISRSRSSRSEEQFITNGSDCNDSSDEDNDNVEESNNENDIDDRDDDDENDTPAPADWNRDLTDFPLKPPFDGNSGLNTDIVEIDNASPLSCFRLFFSDSIITHIKEETNRYASLLKKTAPFKEKRVVKDWKPVTMLEMHGFILLLLHMGYVVKKSLSEYWTTNEFSSSNFANRIMSRDRFKSILSMLHFSNNQDYVEVNHPDHDPLFKIKPIYQHLQERFQTVYTPECNIAIDEAMCGWRGKLRFKVYLRDKPTPWGIKLYELCESKSGYVYRFEIYAADPKISNRPTDVVMRLMDPLLDKGFHLFTDNYYTCPALYQQLVSRDTMCTGTVRSNRLGMPKDLAKEKLKVGEISYRRKDHLVALKWRDKREVNLLTSAYDPTSTTTVTTRNVRDKVKPSVVAGYSKNMSGVDHSDQLLSYLPLARRTAKWTTKLFMHLLTLSIVQASIILNKCLETKSKSPLKLTDFVNKLGNELKDEYLKNRGTRSRPPPKQVTKPQTLLRLDHSKFHNLDYLPATEKNAKPRRQCKVCYDKSATEPGKRKRGTETYVQCVVCKIPLCIGRCCYVFHTELDYTATP